MYTKVYAKLKKSVEYQDRDWTTRGKEISATFRFTATAHIESHGSQHPYFCITAEDQRIKPPQNDIRGGGRMDEEIARRFPEWEKYQKWNLVSSDGPMHYIPNALYWAGFTQFPDERNIDHLKSTIVYGALPDDYNHDPYTMEKEELVDWLANRLPRLLEAFKEDMSELFDDQIEWIE